jgi:hypothetical protein
MEFKQILEYDKASKIGKTIFDFGENGIETHIQKAYSVEEMDKFLLECGFKIMNRYKDFKLSPVDDKAYKIFYVELVTILIIYRVLELELLQIL